MDDDFNSGGAVGALYELLTGLNRYADAKKLEGPEANMADLLEWKLGVAVLREISDLLGLFWQPPAKPQAGDDRLVAGLQKLLADLNAEATQQTPDALMQKLITLCAEARKAKNFATADTIRKRLAELGVTLEDRPGGTGWRVG